MSVETHRGAEHSRRDDLEALCNIIIYFFNKGTLPWDIPKPKMHTIDMKDPKAYQQQLVQKRAEQKYEKDVIEKKENITIEELC